MSYQTYVTGFPRIGKNRELKFAIESYFKGQLSSAELEKTAEALREYGGGDLQRRRYDDDGDAVGYHVLADYPRGGGADGARGEDVFLHAIKNLNLISLIPTSRLHMDIREKRGM